MTICKAKYAGICILCSGRIYVGDVIYLGTRVGNDVAAHKECVNDDPGYAAKIFDKEKT